ncbi:muscarinic acetylcholine receptor M5-like [Patiria miniata]|uniref:G-protein coupled receptors family 1 profile domain-containing protein n=1 Tax=Patiria miniata TaxID=46514 RepID=A0A914AJ90_PATMI|nr:muscarinic acetylcholine receptor M5-like [Patiria miniata]
MATTSDNGAFSMTTEMTEYMATKLSDWFIDNGPLNSTMDPDYQSMYHLPDINGSDYLLNTTFWFDLSTEEPTPIPLPGRASLIEIIIRVVSLIITLFGNALVLYTYATTKNLRTYTNYYIVGLAVADFFSGGVLQIIIFYHSFLGYWPFTEVACTCMTFISHVFLQATFLMTVVICYDRFRALNMPLKHLKDKTMRHACFLISLAYIIPVLLWTPIIVVFPYVGLATRIRPPLCTGPYALHPPLLIFTILVLSWIPMLVTSVLYAFVYSAVIRRGVNKKRGIGEEASSNNKTESRLASLRATRTLTYIMITMVVTALPWSIFALWAAIDPYTLPIRGHSFDVSGFNLGFVLTQT